MLIEILNSKAARLTAAVVLMAMVVTAAVLLLDAVGITNPTFGWMSGYWGVPTYGGW